MKYFIGFSILIFSGVSIADSNIGYHAYSKFGSLTVDEPDGDSPSDAYFSPGLLVTIPTGSRGSRFFSRVELFDKELEGSSGEVRQDVSGVTFSTGYEKQWVFSKSVKPWLGAAINLNNHTFENRYVVDSDGFLVSEFDDREETSLGITLSAINYFSVGKDFKIGLGGYSDIGFSDGFNTVGLNISLGYE